MYSSLEKSGRTKSRYALQIEIQLFLKSFNRQAYTKRLINYVDIRNMIRPGETCIIFFYKNVRQPRQRYSPRSPRLLYSLASFFAEIRLHLRRRNFLMVAQRVVTLFGMAGVTIQNSQWRAVPQLCTVCIEIPFDPFNETKERLRSNKKSLRATKNSVGGC